MQITSASFRKPQTLFGFICKYLKIKVTPARQKMQSLFSNMLIYFPRKLSQKCFVSYFEVLANSSWKSFWLFLSRLRSCKICFFISEPLLSQRSLNLGRWQLSIELYNIQMLTVNCTACSLLGSGCHCLSWVTFLQTSWGSCSPVCHVGRTLWWSSLKNFS